MANSIYPSSSSIPIPSSKTTINDLPQHILIHIISFLYISDAIGTSLISRSFRNLWHFLPSLHFDIVEFYSRTRLIHPRSDNSRKLFADFVSHTLNVRQHNPLTKLQLTFEYTTFHVHKHHMQCWIQYAMNSSVSELVIDLRDEFKFCEWKDPDDDSDEEEYQQDRLCEFDFYVSDIGKTSIKVLKLYKCEPIFPLETDPIKFISLKSLTITDVWVIENYELSNLLARCVNLEILTLVRIAFIARAGLVVHSSTLKELNLFLCSNYDDKRLDLDLDICCPSLQKIMIECSELGKVNIKDTGLFEKACIDFRPLFGKEDYDKSWERMLSFFTNISSLQAWHELLESNEVPAGCELFASNVKHLELYCCYNGNDLVGLAALLKLLPKLEILVLNNRGRTDGNLRRDYTKASTVFNMPCLKQLIIRNYRKTKRELHFIKLFKKNGIVLDKIQLLRPTNQMEYINY